MFDDNSESPFFEVGGVGVIDSQTFDIDLSKEIRFINMKVHAGVDYEGL